MLEEQEAADVYRYRQTYADETGDKKTSDLYEHVIAEEIEHKKEFGDRKRELETQYFTTVRSSKEFEQIKFQYTFDESPYEAGQYAGMGMDTIPEALERLQLSFGRSQVTISPWIVHKNTYELYVANDKGDFVRELSPEEKLEFERGIRDWLREAVREGPTKRIWPETSEFMPWNIGHNRDKEETRKLHSVGRTYWTIEKSGRRMAILSKLRLPVEPYWTYVWDKLPNNYKDAIGAYYSIPTQEYVQVLSPGQTVFHYGDLVSVESFNKENERVKKLGENPATGQVWRGGKAERLPQTKIEEVRRQRHEIALRGLAKEPWQRTINEAYEIQREAWMKQGILRGADNPFEEEPGIIEHPTIANIRESQGKIIKKALAEGKPVPSEVLEEYPDKELANFEATVKSRFTEPIEKYAGKIKEGDLEFIPDSPEYLTQTIDASGWRQQLEQTFQERILKVRNHGS
jgi:hypothetical protein